MRSGWKSGDHLVRDGESGFTEYASDCAIDAYGVLKRKDQMDSKHPSEFKISPKKDPYPVKNLAPPLREWDITSATVTANVGATTVPHKVGPASHLYD